MLFSGNRLASITSRVHSIITPHYLEIAKSLNLSHLLGLWTHYYPRNLIPLGVIRINQGRFQSLLRRKRFVQRGRDGIHQIVPSLYLGSLNLIMHDEFPWTRHRYHGASWSLNRYSKQFHGDMYKISLRYIAYLLLKAQKTWGCILIRDSILVSL